MDDKIVAGVRCIKGHYEDLKETEDWIQEILIKLCPVEHPVFIFRPDQFVFELVMEGNHGDLKPRPDLSPMKLLFNFPPDAKEM